MGAVEVKIERFLDRMTEFCEHNEDGDNDDYEYDDERPRWMWSLRDKPEETKPAWNKATKVNSPAIRTYSEGGSLATARIRPRGKCSKSNHTSHHRSKSPGVAGSTFASRARQKEPVRKPLLRSRASSVVTIPRGQSRTRTRSLSPRRSRPQSASPAPSRPASRQAPTRPSRKQSPTPAPRPAPTMVPIPVTRYPEKEKTPHRLIPINVTEERYSSRTFETSWNDRYLFEPVGPTLGRTNIISDDTDKDQNQDIYKQQNSETTFNSFLGKTREVSQSSSFNSDSRKSSMMDSRKSSLVDSRKSLDADQYLMDSRMSREKSILNSRSSSRAEQSLMDSSRSSSRADTNIRRSSLTSNNNMKQSNNGHM